MSKPTFPIQRAAVSLRALILGARRLYDGQFSFFTLQDSADSRPSALDGAAGDLVVNLRPHVRSLYFQDDCRLRPNLTLNLGIRYESSTQPASSPPDLTIQRESNPATAIRDTDLPLSARTVPLPPPNRNTSTSATVTWHGGDPTGYVIIQGGVGSPYLGAEGRFVCTERVSAGQFTVPCCKVFPPALRIFSTAYFTATQTTVRRFRASGLDFGLFRFP